MGGGSVYSLENRKRLYKIKTCSNPIALSVSEVGDWVATINQSGRIIVSRLSDGQLISKYKRPPYQNSSQLTLYDDLNFLDSSDGVVHLHNIESGGISRTYKYGDDGWMSEGLAYSKKRKQIIVGASPKYTNPTPQRNSILHFFEHDIDTSPNKTLELSGDLCSMKLSPDEGRIALLFHLKKKRKIEIEIYSFSGELVVRNELPIGNDSLPCIGWTHDGKQLTIVTYDGRLIFLDSKELTINHEFQAPKLTGIAFHSDGQLISLTGESKFGGIVLPNSELKEWSEREGKLRQQQLHDEYYAWELLVKLRKASPCRAALFIIDNEIIFESEKLAGYFRYVPNKVVDRLKQSDSPKLIGHALRKTLDSFETTPDARESVLGPDFDGEEDYLVSSGIPKNRLTCVRYLGYERPYSIDYTNVEMMLTVIPFEGQMHFWICGQTDDGRFYESDWPHYYVSENLDDEELGMAIAVAIEKLSSR